MILDGMPYDQALDRIIGHTIIYHGIKCGNANNIIKFMAWHHLQ